MLRIWFNFSISIVFLGLGLLPLSAMARVRQSTVFDEATLDRLAPPTKERIFLYRFHPLAELDLLNVVQDGVLTDKAFEAYNHRFVPPEVLAQPKTVKTLSLWTRIRAAIPAIPIKVGQIQGTGFWARRHEPSWIHCSRDTTLIEVIIEPGTRIFDDRNLAQARAEFPGVNFEDPTIFPVVYKVDDVYITRVQEGIKVREPTFEDLKTAEIIELMRDFQREKGISKSGILVSTIDKLHERLLKQLASRTDFSMEELKGLPGTSNIESYQLHLQDLEREIFNDQRVDFQAIAHKYFSRNHFGHEVAMELDAAVKSMRYDGAQQKATLDLIEAVFSPRKRKQYQALGNQFSAELQAHYADINSDNAALAHPEIRRGLSRAVSYLLASEDPAVASQAAHMLDISTRYGYGATTVDLTLPVVEAIRRARDSRSLKQLSNIARFHSSSHDPNILSATMEAVRRLNPKGKERDEILSDCAQAIYYSIREGYDITALRRFVDMTMSEDSLEREIGYEGLDIYGDSGHGVGPMLELAQEIPWQHLVGLIEGVEGMTPRKPYMHLRLFGKHWGISEKARIFFWTLAVHGPSLISEQSVRELQESLGRNPPPIDPEWAVKFQQMSKHTCSRILSGNP